MKTFALAMIVALAWFASAHAALAQTRDADTHFFHTGFRDLPEELELARKEGKLGLVIMFDAEDCPPCKRMKRDILSQTRVQDYYRKHFRVIRIDFNGDQDVVDPRGKTWTEKRYAGKEGVNIRGTPGFLFLGRKGEELARHYGEIRSVDAFMKLGERVGGGAQR